MTAPLPQGGGAFVRDPDGALRPETATPATPAETPVETAVESPVKPPAKAQPKRGGKES